MHHPCQAPTHVEVELGCAKKSNMGALEQYLCICSVYCLMDQYFCRVSRGCFPKMLSSRNCITNGSSTKDLNFQENAFNITGCIKIFNITGCIKISNITGCIKIFNITWCIKIFNITGCIKRNATPIFLYISVHINATDLCLIWAERDSPPVVTGQWHDFTLHQLIHVVCFYVGF